MANCEIFPDKGVLSSQSALASVLALSSASTLFQPVESIISFISLQSSYAWYLNLSQFETVFLGFLMLQISFFRYLEILPININNFFLGEPSGRKRRRRKRWSSGSSDSGSKFDCESDIIMKSMLKVIRKLDEGNCLSMTLCELASMTSLTLASHHEFKNVTVTHSKSISDILAVLRTSAHYRSKLNPEGTTDSSISFPNCSALDGLQVYEEAVVLGSSSQNHHNSTICEQRYSACPLSRQDVEHYIGMLIKANML